MLQDKQSDLRTRRRRGLINAVGSVANSLFGILDNSFAEKYEEDIGLIRKNQGHLAQLWKNQTSVVEAEFNLIKRTESIMEKHHKTVNKKMLELEQSMRALRAESLNSSYISEFTLAAMITNNILYKLKEIQTYLLDTITDIFHGKFNLHILTPEQLQHELSVISTHIPKDLLLPTDHTNLSKLYKLFKIKARLSKSFLMFEIRIPLVTRDVYDIFKVVPIPRQSGAKMISIMPISEYIALNLNKDSFISLSFTDVHDCIKQDINTVLCRFKKPIYHVRNDNSLCEKNEDSGTCKVVMDQCKSIFTATNTLNMYFYFCCDSCYFQLLCEDQVTAIQLSHAGLITLSHNCLIKSSDFHSYIYKQEASHLNLKPNIWLPKIAPVNHLFNISIPDVNASLNLETINQQQLLDIRQQLDVMKQSEPIVESISYHDIHHYAVVYLLIVVAGVLGGFYACRRMRRPQRGHVQNKCDSEVQCVELELQPSAVQCNSGVFISELNDKFTNARKQRQNRSTSPVLQSVFSVTDTGV